MSGNGVAVEDIVFTGSRTDIMDNQRPIADFSIGDDADMGTVAFQFPSYNIASLIVCILNCPALTREISH